MINARVFCSTIARLFMPRFVCRMPLSLKMFVALSLLLSAGSALRIGVPAYRRIATIHDISRANGSFLTDRRSPDWLRIWLCQENPPDIDDVAAVYLNRSESE